MNKHFIRTLNTLTGKVEELQQRALKYTENGDETARNVWENITRAKLSLSSAIIATYPTNPAAPQPEQPAQQEAQNGAL